MTTKQEGDWYELVVWDFDGAPDAVEYYTDGLTDEELSQSIRPYFCKKRVRSKSFTELQDLGAYEIEERYRVGCAVFLDGKELWSIGLVFDYRKRYI